MSYSSVCTSAPFATVASITGRIVTCRTSGSIRRTTSPPRCRRPRIGGFSFASVPRPGAPLRRRRRPGRPLWRRPPAGPRGRPRRRPRRSRPPLPAPPAGARRWPAPAVDPGDPAPPSQPRRREPGGEPLPQGLGHGLHVGDAEVEFPGDLPVGEVQPHQVQARHPDPQRPVAPGQHGAGQGVEADPAVVAAVALPVGLGVVPAVAGDPGAAAVRAADALGPAVLPDQLEASRVIDQRRQGSRGLAWAAPRLTGGPLLNRLPPLSAPSGRPPRNPTRASDKAV